MGARLLVPGLPQWSWDQRERALFLFGSFATAVVVGVLTWGTTVSLAILFFAVASHVFSAVDAIRQNAFPGFGRIVPTATASAGLGVALYTPALALASVYAWPIALDDRPREGYLVNRRAYAQEAPRTGDTVWIRSRAGQRSRVGRVVAGPGQRVEWSANAFRVDDQAVGEHPFLENPALAEWKLTIPEGHSLVIFPADPRRLGGTSEGWEILDQREIRGRAWARSYPIWDRGLLP